MDFKKNKEQIIKKFEEIEHKDGLILIENIINNKYDEYLIKDIIKSLSKNKKKYTYEIYDYIIKNTNLNYDTILDKYDDNSLIHLCALNGNIDLLNYLIKKGVDINLKNKYGSTSLIFASVFSINTPSLEIIELLLDYRSDINFQNNDGNTALMLSSRYLNSISSIETIKLLLENGASVNLKNKEGRTAYDIAPTKECRNLIKLYIN